MTRTAKLLRELIALPSVNPAFLPERHPHAGEGRVAEYLAAVGAEVSPWSRPTPYTTYGRKPMDETPSSSA